MHVEFNTPKSGRTTKLLNKANDIAKRERVVFLSLNETPVALKQMLLHPKPWLSFYTGSLQIGKFKEFMKKTEANHIFIDSNTDTSRLPFWLNIQKELGKELYISCNTLVF